MTGKVTEYTYNALDLIEKVTDNGTVTAEYGYYPDGSIRSLKNGNLYTEYAFDADKNLTGLKTTLGMEVLADNHYTYDFNGIKVTKNTYGTAEGYKQFCSHYSCGSCGEIQRKEGVMNYTGYEADHGTRTRRYSDILY